MKSGAKGLCPGCFGLAVGIIWGLWCFIAGLAFHGNFTMVNAMGSIYVGYGPTFMGSLIGGLWGLLHGFIAGFLVVWLYNSFSRSCKCRHCKVCCCCGKKDCNGTNCSGHACNTESK